MNKSSKSTSPKLFQALRFVHYLYLIQPHRASNTARVYLPLSQSPAVVGGLVLAGSPSLDNGKVNLSLQAFTPDFTQSDEPSDMFYDIVF